jgi:hypothetical protein
VQPRLTPGSAQGYVWKVLQGKGSQGTSRQRTVQCTVVRSKECGHAEMYDVGCMLYMPTTKSLQTGEEGATTYGSLTTEGWGHRPGLLCMGGWSPQKHKVLQCNASQAIVRDLL